MRIAGIAMVAALAVGACTTDGNVKNVVSRETLVEENGVRVWLEKIEENDFWTGDTMKIRMRYFASNSGSDPACVRVVFTESSGGRMVHGKNHLVQTGQTVEVAMAQGVDEVRVTDETYVMPAWRCDD